MSAEIQSTSIAALRYLVGDNHEYDYVDGGVIWPPAPGIEEVFGKDGEYYTYFIPDSAFGILSAVNYLADYIASEGPFDAVMGFSQGASLAATLILRNQEAKSGHPASAHPQNPFKCAIFLSGQLPFDCADLERGKIRQLAPDIDNVVMEIPTAHFWGINDTLYPDASPKLCRLCAEGSRLEVTHMAGHGVPSKGDELERMAVAFRETLHKAR